MARNNIKSGLLAVTFYLENKDFGVCSASLHHDKESVTVKIVSGANKVTLKKQGSPPEYDIRGEGPAVSTSDDSKVFLANFISAVVNQIARTQLYLFFNEEEEGSADLGEFVFTLSQFMRVFHHHFGGAAQLFAEQRRETAGSGLGSSSKEDPVKGMEEEGVEKTGTVDRRVSVSSSGSEAEEIELEKSLERIDMQKKSSDKVELSSTDTDDSETFLTPEDLSEEQ